VVSVPPQADASPLLHPAPGARAAATTVRFLTFLVLLFAAQVVKTEEED
jgi:hypothetical protein